jgi:hypothetical protein
MLMFRQRRQTVIVAVVYQPERGFFVHFHEKWRGYTFPLRRRHPTDFEEAYAAREALRAAVGRPLHHAEARPLEYLPVVGVSQRTDREVLYQYQAFEVEPNEPLPDGGLGCRHGFLTLDALLQADLVTWTTKALVGELLGNQQVAVAVVCRPGPDGCEFLMIRSASYRGYFPPASRLKTDVSPRAEARQAVERETGYHGRSTPGQPLTVKDVHFSPRFQCDRQFVFHVVPVVLPALDLSGVPNELEHQLQRTGVLWRWVSEAELADPPGNGLSPTVAAIREALLQAARQAGCP